MQPIYLPSNALYSHQTKVSAGIHVYMYVSVSEANIELQKPKCLKMHE